MAPTSVEEEANDDDHKILDEVTTELRRSTRVRSAREWYDNPVLEALVLMNILSCLSALSMLLQCSLG